MQGINDFLLHGTNQQLNMVAQSLILEKYFKAIHIEQL